VRKCEIDFVFVFRRQARTVEPITYLKSEKRMIKSESSYLLHGKVTVRLQAYFGRETLILVDDLIPNLGLAVTCFIRADELIPTGENNVYLWGCVS